MALLHLGRVQFSVRSLLHRDRGPGTLFGSGGMGNAGTAADASGTGGSNPLRAAGRAPPRRVARERRPRSGRAPRSIGPDVDATRTPAVPPEILIEHLRRENDELKDTVDSLRLEVQRLRAANRR